MNDIITKSFVAGLVSFLYKNITNHILYYLGITPFLYRVEAATLVLPYAKANTFYGVVIGLFTDLIIIVWFALIIAYVLKATGQDYALMKGAFVGASAWVAVYGFFIHIGIVELYKPRGFASGLTSIFFDITMGIVSAAVYVYLSRKEELVSR